MIKIGEPIRNTLYYVMVLDSKGEGIHCLENGKKVCFNTQRKAKRFVRRAPTDNTQFRIVERRMADTTYILDRKGR